ncbi:hypothetical protein ABW19_dt0209534 [Dactylella cylindrospora]|nr:hypothetical protein ABW19_dt0209534 [Dactylella cylindrospora]
MRWTSNTLLLVPALAATVAAQCTVLTNDLAAPVMAPGYQSQIAVEGLKFPRHIQFDTTGHLLVVDRGAGIYRFSVDECLLLQDKTLIIDDPTLNHGISISPDGSTLFASNNDTAYSWSYDADTGAATNRRPLVTGMANQGGHITRTLLSPVSKPDWLIISVGSQENVDLSTLQISSGKSQIRAFNVSEVTEEPVVFREGGYLLGWGLRNSVGVAEDPSAQLWSVENSVDHVERNGESIHQNNPAEELNFHGSLLEDYDRGSYGYPNCYAVWNASEIPDQTGLETGDQFAQVENSTLNDDYCRETYQPPRISFHAHQAPLDIKFDSDGHAWIAFHGSWNRDTPIGYRVVTVNFANGQPTEANNSQSAALEIMANADLMQCENSCFRPVGLAFDTAGHLWMSSDATGEIYVIRKTDGSGVAPYTSTAAVSGPTPGPTGTSTGTASETSTPAAASSIRVTLWALFALFGAQLLVHFL